MTNFKEISSIFEEMPRVVFKRRQRKSGGSKRRKESFDYYSRSGGLYSDDDNNTFDLMSHEIIQLNHKRKVFSDDVFVMSSYTQIQVASTIIYSSKSTRL